MAQLNPQEWLQIVILGDWPDYNTINNSWTFIGKKKMPCL
jgi:hypothetical protein